MVQPIYEIMEEKLISEKICNTRNLNRIKNIIKQSNGTQEYNKEIGDYLEEIRKSSEDKQLMLFINAYSNYLQKDKSEIPKNFSDDMRTSDFYIMDSMSFNKANKTRRQEEYGNK